MSTMTLVKELQPVPAARVEPAVAERLVLPEVERTVEAAERVTRADIVDVWGQDSFPASDAPANW
ncbi:hypothetical protein [Nocardioides caldifontis]|uniref:hypothetical protein n=1 Tax=Nocardioides caldifontis TaxID=2588938 RepID=UPI0011DFB6FD|nr:hypothetical protein [Nocardioides caldifontis]